MNTGDKNNGSGEPFPEEVEEQIQKYLDDDLTAEEFAQFQELLKGDSRVRGRFIEASEMANLLRHAAEQEMAEDQPMLASSENPKRQNLLTLSFFVCAAVVAIALINVAFSRHAVGATVMDLADADWLNTPVKKGERLRLGDQIQLAAGSAVVEFKSGASTRILGPALFEVESTNSGILHYGKTVSTADNEASKGFAIRTASGTYVDQGTEFFTEAMTDGRSQMFVIKGAVDAQGTVFNKRRISSGNGIGFGLGETPVMIQIESGSETPEFVFPSIPPPSSEDFASTNPVVIDSQINKINSSVAAPASAAVEVLVNGGAQKSADDPDESFFFRENSIGYLIFDLQEARPISHIHTYSWHRNRTRPEMNLRAVQRFTVWGARQSRPSNLPDEISDGGWTRIAQVDTDAFFQFDEKAVRPAQQACRILPNEGTLGDFQFLLFEMLPTSEYHDILPRHTFFSEIDIFTETHD